MIQRLKHIWSRNLAHSSEIVFIYTMQLIFGISVGFIFYNTIHNNLGQSIALENLAIGFDRTVFMDMINNNDGVFSDVLSWSSILVPMYLILSIWFQGGLLYNIKKGETGIKSQIKNGVKYLVPFLGFGLISIFLIIISAAFIGLPSKSIIGDPLTSFSSEKPFVFLLIILLALFSVCITFIWGYSISTRYNYLEQSSFWDALKLGGLFMKNHFLKILSIGYLMIGIHLLLALLYFLLMKDRGAQSWLIVIFGIVTQQVFSFARIFFRSFGYIAIVQLDDEFIG